jgi:uncharacterized protein (DUF1697 family)
MHRYIAFLRAINVGGHTVKMDRLRALFQALDLEDVETFIASGNVIFRSPSADAAALETRIEAHLKAELGYEVATFLRTPAQVAASAADQPFGEIADAHGLYIGYTRSAPAATARDALVALSTENDDLAVHGREVYWLCRVRVSDSKLTGGRLEKALGMPLTVRNVTTVRKLAEKYAE